MRWRCGGFFLMCSERRLELTSACAIPWVTCVLPSQKAPDGMAEGLVV